MTVAEAIDSFLFHCRFERNLSPKTVKAYATDLAQFSAHLAPDAAAPDVAAVTKEIIRDYIQALHTRFAEKSIKRKLASLKALFRFLEGDDAISISPFRKLQIRLRETRKLPRTAGLAEIQTLFEHLYQGLRIATDDRAAGRSRLIRDIAVFETLFATGARVSEVCSLKVADVDLDVGFIRILGKGAKERIVQICDPEALRALHAYRAVREGLAASGAPFFVNLRGNALSEQSVRTALRKHAAAAGLAGSWTPHLFRHTVATLLLLEGVDLRHIQHLLGHSSIATTEIYTHVDNQTQREVLRTKHPRRHLRV
jgi:integrase/recombinase XerD